MLALRLNLTSPTKGSELKINLQCYWESCQAILKCQSQSWRNVSNCSISLGVSRAECIQFPVDGAALAATSRAIMAASDWLRGAATRTNGRPGSGREEAVAWFLAAGTIWAMQRRGLARAGDSRPARPLKNGCKSSGGPTWDDLEDSRPASGLQQGREQYFGPPHGILIVDQECRRTPWNSNSVAANDLIIQHHKTS